MKLGFRNVWTAAVAILLAGCGNSDPACADYDTSELPSGAVLDGVSAEDAVKAYKTPVDFSQGRLAFGAPPSETSRFGPAPLIQWGPLSGDGWVYFLTAQGPGASGRVSVATRQNSTNVLDASWTRFAADQTGDNVAIVISAVQLQDGCVKDSTGGSHSLRLK